MRKVNFFMGLLKELSSSLIYIFQIHNYFVKYLKTIKVVLLSRSLTNYHQEKKHIAIKYYILRSFVQNNIIQICYIDKLEQTAEIFTKPLEKALFIYLQKNNLDGELKSVTAASVQGSLIIKRTNLETYFT